MKGSTKARFFTDADLVDGVLRVVGEQYGGVDHKLTDRFVENMGGDSLDQVELTMAIEDHFGIEIPDEDAQRFTTPESVIAYLRGRQ